MLLPIMGIAQAGADYAPQPNDIVGVGGDTPQFAVDFGLNGDTAGAAGFNSTATVNRVVDFDATADGNARTAYTQGSSEKTPSLLNPTDVLRAGTSPVQRISSSGNAITALLADQGSPETINYIFSGSLPTAAKQSTAGTKGSATSTSSRSALTQWRSPPPTAPSAAPPTPRTPRPG